MSVAHVTSTDAIASFRATLIVYLSKARPILEDGCDEVARTRQWLQHDRRMHWENQLRRRTRELENAQQALYSARLANLREPTQAEQSAVQRAKRALTEAEEKLKLIKRWSLEFDQRVGPLVKQLEQLRTLLANDLPKGVAHLAQVVKVLEEYANVARPSPAAVTTAPASEAKTDGSDAGTTGQGTTATEEIS
jgi:hypothetical protein